MESVASPSLDLKWSLTLRVVAVALVCFLVAAALALFGTYRDLRQANENVADIVVRQLQIQLFRIEADIDVREQFPDWDPVAERVQRAGSVHPIHQAGRQHRAIELCRRSITGTALRRPGFPRWARWLLAGRADVARPVSYHGKISRNARRHDGDGRAFWPRSGRTFRGCSA